VRSPVSHDDASSSAVYGGRVLHAATSIFAPTAAGVGLAVLAVVLLWWSNFRSARVGRVSWADFERQFAEYVAEHSSGGRTESGDGRDRADQRPPEKRSARRPE
jgi:hypothetical protein